jgi:AraC-like DNA-binding protein
MKSSSFYGTIFCDYTPSPVLQPVVAAYWLLDNQTGGTIHVPVVPDGCSDVIFYLNHDESPFVVGVMRHAQVIPTPDGMQLFGIRFRPGRLSFVLGEDMRALADTTQPLANHWENFADELRAQEMVEQKIISCANGFQESLLPKIVFNDSFLHIVDQLISATEIPIKELARDNNLCSKRLERLFYRHIGVSPKQFAGIMRFYKAHKNILHHGLQDLVTTSLNAGYFDQAHFNREYKKLTGTNPTSEVMSILYKNSLD